MELEELIAELERAVEGSDALDRKIAAACGVKWSADENGNFGGYNILPRRCHFSRSLDAALTLYADEETAAHNLAVASSGYGMSLFEIRKRVIIRALKAKSHPHKAGGQE